MVYPVVIKCTASEKQKLHSQKTGPGSFSSHHRGIWYFTFLLKLNDRCFMGFLTFIWPVVQWITWQWSFAPILLPWNVRFSLLLVLGKYSYVLGQQPSWHVPPTSGRFHTPVHWHSRKSKWKGSIDNYFALLICCHLCKVCICFILQIINVKWWWKMCWNYILKSYWVCTCEVLDSLEYKQMDYLCVCCSIL